MPFTTAHIAAILPLKKFCPQIFSISSLVIGSMIPDFEYFIRMTLYGHYGHTLNGIFIFDIPLGIILYIIFHEIVRLPSITYLPTYFYSRFGSAAHFEWKPYFLKNFAKIVLSLFIGIMTHFIWDSFTHDEEYFFAKYVPILLENINVFGHNMPLHYFLQILSTFVGMIILFWYAHLLPSKYSKRVKSNEKIFNFWVLVLILAVIIGSIRWSIGMPNEKIVGQLIVVCVSSSLLSLLIVSFISTKKLNIITKYL
jgi:hypothetical protein